MLNDIIISFLTNLKKDNITSCIVGGQAYKKYFNKDELTTDYDIHIYIDFKQLNDKNTFKIIYSHIKTLYRDCKTIYQDLYSLTKFDYAHYSKKYLDTSLLNKQTEYYISNIICDIQFENEKETFVDISIEYSPDIKNKISTLSDDFFIKKEYYIKDIYNFYDTLNNSSDKDKIKKIKNRIKVINSLK